MGENTLFFTSVLLASAGKVYSPGGLLVSGGKILFCGDRQTASLFAPTGTKKVDLPGTVLFPGFVNAHTHLTIPPLPEQPDKDFVGWLLEVMRLRVEKGHNEFREYADESLRECVESGVTLAAEISGGGIVRFDEARIRLRVYLELLGMTEERWRESSEHIESSLDATGDGGDMVRMGLSPHSLYTCSKEALLWARELCGRRGVPCQIHFAESLPELEYIRSGGGEIKERIYSAFSISDGDFSGYGEGLTDVLKESIPSGAALVHVTCLSREELDSLGKAGFSFVLCVRSNRYLTGQVPKLDAVVDGGYLFGVGTDSRGSCGRIDMFEELRSAADAYHGSLKSKELYPRLFAGATSGGAEIAGFSDICGSLDEGKMADFCALEISSGKERVFSDIIEKGEGKHIADVRVSGESVIGF
jgi:5-methylthioadenosine/S-adenosylhomocysteine deaminase